MKVLYQLIYEWQKGVRELALFTAGAETIRKAEDLLKKHKICYLTLACGSNKNLFFGNPSCLEVIKSFSSTNLSKLNAQEDFILGAMLGYSIKEQSTRYIKQLLVR